MNYKINFFYKDDRQIAIIIPESEVSKLFEELSQGMVYRNADSGSGFWTDIRDIRYITAQKVTDGDSIEKNGICEECIETLPCGEEDSESGEESSGEA